MSQDREHVNSVLERIIASHPEVERGMVVTASEPVVVVVPHDVCRALDIRDELSHAIGEVEPVLLVVSALPVDEAALHQELSTSTSLYRYEPPATSWESTLAELVACTLGRSRVGVLDDYTDLGGDSLTAIMLVDVVYEELGVELTLVELFAAMTVRRMAELVEHRVGNVTDTPVKV